MSLNRTLAGLITTTGDVKSASLDNAASLTVYATKEDLPSSGMSSGDQAYVTGNSRFYISNGSGWYNVALVNATPSLSIDPTGAIALSNEGATTIITLTATDSDNAVAGLTYSVESDGSFGGLATISQDSSVFTITPLSEDSATTVESTLTFKASDGISFGSGTRTLTLSFKVQYSNYTTLLAKADTTGTDNQIDASTNSYTITENGNVTSTALSPYHPGGYSTYFDGTSNSQILIQGESTLAVGTGNFSCSLWYKSNGALEDRVIASSVATTSTTQLYWNMSIRSDGALWLQTRSTANGGLQYFGKSATGLITANTWHHLVVARIGGVHYCAVDGVEDTSVTQNTATMNITAQEIAIGASNITSYQAYNKGYMRDFNFCVGGVEYDLSAGNYTVPDEPISPHANTKVLMANKPYIKDTSASPLTIDTIGSAIKTVRVGPYDYLSYEKADYGGSVYLDGTGDYLQTSSPVIPASGNFTIETWVYITNTSSRREIVSQYEPPGEGRLTVCLNSGNIEFFIGSTLGNVLITSSAVKANTWYHIAAVRSSNNYYLYVNGQLVGSDTGGKNISIQQASYNTTIGVLYNNGYLNYMLGYVADVRIVSDAVYTSEFTPPTAPLTAITNTELLTCTNKNKFFDASANAPVMTPGGSVAANSSEVAYTGNSIYFSTRSDEISGNGTLAAFNTLPGDFTIELECKLTSSNMAYAFVLQLYSGSNNDNAIIRFGDSGFGYHLQFVINNGGGTGAVYNINLVQSDFTSGFRHIAWTRESGTNRVFIDGTQYNVATGTNPSTFTNASWSDSTTISFNNADGIRIGQASYAPLGYLQNIRVTNGLARYTGNFTPPTAEFGG